MASRGPPALWRIGKLPVAEIKERLQAASLSTTGTKQTRLHVHLQSLATASASEMASGRDSATTSGQESATASGQESATASGYDCSSSSPFPASSPPPHAAAAGEDIALNDGRASATAGPRTTAHGDSPVLYLPRFCDCQIPPHPTTATPVVLANRAKACIDGTATVTAGTADIAQ